MPSLIFPYHKTRIAPTPSGFLHLGNLLSFIITAFIAERENAEVLLRIDDLDKNRVRDVYIEDIFDTMNFFEIPWKEGPRNLIDFQEKYSQAKRGKLYNQALNMLREKNLVYACTCSRTSPGNLNDGSTNSCKCAIQQIPLNTENAAWKLITGDEPEIQFTAYRIGLKREKLPPGMKNFVVKKKDGNPSYQLASVIDDTYFSVDLVVRGVDLYPSTIAQNFLAAALGKNEFKNIAFLHHPLILDLSGEKLSKTDGATSLQNLRQAGFTAIEIYNKLADMLGYKQKVNSGHKLAEMVINDFIVNTDNLK